MAVQAHVVQRVLVVVRQTLRIHVLVDLHAQTQLHIGADSGIADLGDVGRFARVGHGVQLAVMVVPGSLDDFHLDFGMLGHEVVGPGINVVQISARYRGNHHGNGVGRLRESRGHAQQHHGRQQKSQELFHVFTSNVSALWNVPHRLYCNACINVSQ